VDLASGHLDLMDLKPKLGRDPSERLAAREPRHHALHLQRDH
jgi:hypothetical protein